MIAPREIVEAIQRIPSNNSSMRFLVSLADSAFKYGTLTPKQESTFKETIAAIKEKGYWNENIG